MDKSDNNNNNSSSSNNNNIISTNTQRETRDFMNVESFSQLPFIRPTSLKEKGNGGGSTGGGAIRLFGKEFGGSDGAAAEEESGSADTNCCGPVAGEADSSSKDNNINEGNSNTSGGGGGGGGGGGDSNRRFECHYCCRNFPTSQALGGHQNAHKRERQHAKRAHLQSTMAHAGGSAVDGSHVYGLLNYHHRLGAAYPTWNAGSGRFYGGRGGGSASIYSQPPINGSPLALWRIPPSVQSGAPFGITNPNAAGGSGRGSMQATAPVLPLFAGEEMKTPAVQAISGAGGPRGFVYHHDSKSAAVQDHVSLDLHL